MTDPTTDSATASEHDDDSGQALQINENTIDDPGTDGEVRTQNEDQHGRRDVPESDQALQINDNTIDDKK